MNRGDVYELKPPRRARGHEQRGRRYGVVLQASQLGSLSTTIVAPTSTRARPASFRPEVQIRSRSTRLMVDQLRAVDHTRLGKRVSRLGAAEMLAIDEALQTVLGLG